MQVNSLLRGGLLLAAVLSSGQPAKAQYVGIGTSTPTQLLDVNGSLRVRGLAGAIGSLLSLAADGTLQVQPPLFGAAAPATFPALVGQAAVLTNGSPQGVAVNLAGTRAFVINAGSGKLQTFDLSAGGRPQSISSVDAGYYVSDLYLNAAGTRLYTTGPYDVIRTYDVSSGIPVQIAKTTAAMKPSKVVVNAAGTRVFFLTEGFVVGAYGLDSNGVPNSGNSSFITTGTLLAIALNPTGTRLYTLSLGRDPADNLLTTYDVSGSGDAVSLGAVPTGKRPQALVVNGAGTLAYVLNGADNTLQTYRLSSNTLPVSLSTVPTGKSPQALALNAAGTRLYVTNTGDNTLQTFDVSAPGLPARLSTSPTGLTPQAVAANPARPALYVVNSGENTLQVFGQDNEPRPLVVGASGELGSLGAAQLPGAGRLPAAYGSVGGGGTVLGAAGSFTVTHRATGTYRLSFTASPLRTADLNQADTVATLSGAAPGSLSYRTGTGYLDVFTFGPGGTAADRSFSFSVSIP